MIRATNCPEQQPYDGQRIRSNSQAGQWLNDKSDKLPNSLLYASAKHIPIVPYLGLFGLVLFGHKQGDLQVDVADAGDHKGPPRAAPPPSPLQGNHVRKGLLNLPVEYYYDSPC